MATSRTTSNVGTLRRSTVDYGNLIDPAWDDKWRVEIVWHIAWDTIPLSVTPINCWKCGVADASPESDNAESCTECSAEIKDARNQPYDNH